MAGNACAETDSRRVCSQADAYFKCSRCVYIQCNRFMGWNEFSGSPNMENVTIEGHEGVFYLLKYIYTVGSLM